MDKAPLSETEVFEILRQAHKAGRIVLFTVPSVLNKPGSPVYSPLDVFVPPVVLLASSLTLLFAFGLVQWIVGLILVLLYQRYLAVSLVEWRLHRRTVRAALVNASNFTLLWHLGGIAVALKAWPERNCVGPRGDWRKFVAEYLVDAPEGDVPKTEKA